MVKNRMGTDELSGSDALHNRIRSARRFLYVPGFSDGEIKMADKMASRQVKRRCTLALCDHRWRARGS
jgi:hypothetical protein